MFRVHTLLRMNVAEPKSLSPCYDAIAPKQLIEDKHDQITD